VHSAALYVVRPSVFPSVCDVDGSGSHRLEILETNCTAISPTPSLFIAQKPSTYSQGNMGKSGETRGGVGKSGVLEHKSGISLKRVKIDTMESL